jgi:integral membrane protein
MFSFNTFRLIALLEGLSFLLLLGLAMPLKYLYMMPLAVQVIGPIHGLLFMLFCAYLVMIMKRYTLPTMVGVWGFIASLLPFGTLVFDGYIKKRVPDHTLEAE